MNIPERHRDVSTGRLPTRPGWYWVRELDGSRPRVVEVGNRPDGELGVVFPSVWIPVTFGYDWGPEVGPSPWSENG